VVRVVSEMLLVGPADVGVVEHESALKAWTLCVIISHLLSFGPFAYPTVTVYEGSCSFTIYAVPFPAMIFLSHSQRQVKTQRPHTLTADTQRSTPWSTRSAKRYM